MGWGGEGHMTHCGLANSIRPRRRTACTGALGCGVLTDWGPIPNSYVAGQASATMHQAGLVEYP